MRGFKWNDIPKWLRQRAQRYPWCKAFIDVLKCDCLADRSSIPYWLSLFLASIPLPLIGRPRPESLGNLQSTALLDKEFRLLILSIEIHWSLFPDLCMARVLQRRPLDTLSFSCLASTTTLPEHVEKDGVA